MNILSTLKKLQHNDAVVRVEHTLWQAAAGAVVASLAATHGDVRVAVTAGVAAVLSAAKALISRSLAPAPYAGVPVDGGVVKHGDFIPAPVVAPVVPVDVVSTPSTPASTPPAAQ